MKRNHLNLLIDCILFGAALVTFVTGLVFLLRFHAGLGSWRPEALGLDRLTWLNLHRLPGLITVAALITHIALHLKPLKVRISRPGRWKSEITMYFTFFVAASTGVIAWFFVSGSSPLLGPAVIGPLPHFRHVWVDVHHLSGLATLALTVHHVAHRWSWMKRNLRSLFDQSISNKARN